MRSLVTGIVVAVLGVDLVAQGGVPVPAELVSNFGAGEHATYHFPGGHHDVEGLADGKYLRVAGEFDTSDKLVYLEWEAQASGAADVFEDFEEHSLSFYPTAMTPHGGTHLAVWVIGYSDTGATKIEEWRITNLTLGSTIHPVNGTEVTQVGKTMRKLERYSGVDIGFVSDAIWVEDRQALWLLEYGAERTVWEFDPATGALAKLVVPALSATHPVDSTIVPWFDEAASIMRLITDDGVIHYVFPTHHPWDQERHDVPADSALMWFEMIDYGRDGVIDQIGYVTPDDLAAFDLDDMRPWTD